VIGIILSLGFAVVFGVNALFTRKGVLLASSTFAVLTSVFMGPLYFLIISFVTGEVSTILHFSWQAFLFFAASGIIHFSLGRSCAYRSIQLVGATRSYIVTGLSTVVAIVLAIVVLRETFTFLMALGAFFCLSGPTLLAIKENAKKTNPARTGADDNVISSHTLYIGLLYGIGAAVFWGSSPIFIKLGLQHGGSSIAGIFVAYCAASITVSTILLERGTREQFFSLDKKAFRWFLLSGLTVNTAQMLRYIALNYCPVIIVSLLTRTIPLWVLLLSFLFNREHESFSRWVLLGNGLLLIGTILVLL
jgi:drug/metabolite transporter (DMT)-like permease